MLCTCGVFSTTVSVTSESAMSKPMLSHAAVASLAEEGALTAKDVERAIKMWKLDPGKPNPITV